MPHRTYRSFRELLRGLDGYIEELCPYTIDHIQTMFPSLPREIRFRIYFHILLEQGGECEIDHLKIQSLERLPRYKNFRLLFSISQTTSIEAGLYFVSISTFYVYSLLSIEEFIRYLEKFPGEQGFQAVRRIHFTKFSEHVPQPGGAVAGNVDFITRCTGICHLQLCWDNKHLMRAWDVRSRDEDNWDAIAEYGYDLLSMEEVVRRYCLEEIYVLRTLDIITLRFSVKGIHVLRDTVIWVPSTVALFSELAKWLRDGFACRGRKMQIVLELQ